MAESNLKEMMIDEIPEDVNDSNQNNNKDKGEIPWYMINTERTFCKVWDFFITLLIIYDLIVVPFVLIFPEVY